MASDHRTYDGLRVGSFFGQIYFNFNPCAHSKRTHTHISLLYTILWRWKAFGKWKINCLLQRYSIDKFESIHSFFVHSSSFSPCFTCAQKLRARVRSFIVFETESNSWWNSFVECAHFVGRENYIRLVFAGQLTNILYSVSQSAHHIGIGQRNFTTGMKLK